jgi:hypothetical protein
MKWSPFSVNIKMILTIKMLCCFILTSAIANMASAMNQATPVVEVPPIPQSQQIDQFAPLPTSAGQSPETVAFSEEKVGIQGNWMKKKEWLIKSNEVFDEIQNIALEIQGTRKSFNEKYHAIDDEFDNFYKSLSLDQGKLQELFEGLERYLENKKKKKLEELSATNKEDVSEKDYLLKIDLLNSEIKQHKEELEQLKLDLKSIDDLDKSIAERLKRADEQISQAADLYEKAKNTVEDLWSIIDDKKARAIYYDLKGSTVEKLKTILSYLKDDLLRDLDTVMETSRAQMSKTKESIQKLEEKGFIIKNRSQRIEQLKLKELQKIEQAKKEIEHIPTKEEVVDLKKIKKQPTLWYEKIYDYITSTISRAYRFIASFFDFGATKKPTTRSAIDRSRQSKLPPAIPPIPPAHTTIPAAQLATPSATSPTITPTIPLTQNAGTAIIPSMPLAIPPSTPSPQQPAQNPPQPLAIPLPSTALGGMPLN